MEITKYDILAKEIAVLEVDLAKKKAYLQGLHATPFSGGSCSCGADLSTEALFAKHFVISRQNRMYGYLNLGECPNTAKGAVIVAGATIG